MYNPDNVIVAGSNLVYPESSIDLFDVYEGNYDHSLIRFNNLKPYKDASKLYIDIETTTDLENVKNGVVYMIGLRNEKGTNIILTNKNEKQLLVNFLHIIHKKKPEIITGYNIFEFDLPYLEHRFVVNDLNFPFMRSDKLKTHRTAMKFSKPTQFYPYFANRTIGGGAIVDMYHQTLSLDFVLRTLSSYRLKSVVLELGLRSAPRLDIPYSEMMKHYHNWMFGDGNLDDMTKYLIYDLEDTELIANRILPSIYFEQKYLDWNLQSIAYGGNASKWNSILSNHYGYTPEPDGKKNIEGGFTFALPGLYGDVSKNMGIYQLDFTSLYPNIMLRNQVYSHTKDPDKIILSYLDFLTTNRVKLKKLFKTTGDVEADYEQQSAKPFINSAYGLMGTQLIPFNDFKCAAFITAYGRKICKYVKHLITENNGYVCQADTDGLIYYTDKNNSEKLIETVTKSLPFGFGMELDFTADAVYIPSNDEGVGLKKNYIIFNKGKVEKLRGVWNKRNISKIERDFPINYLTKLVYENQESADNYLQEKLAQILELELDLSEIQIIRTVARSEKSIVELGLTYQTPEGLRTMYYMGYGVKVYKRKPPKLHTIDRTSEGVKYLVSVPEKVNKGRYNAEYYHTLITEIIATIKDAIKTGDLYKQQFVKNTKPNE
jgi:DNA polymerase elongation subunit (family B)